MSDFNLGFRRTDEGQELIVLQVGKGEETPYYYSADGSTEAFVRVGNESVPATPTDLRRLVLRGGNSSFDSLDSRYVASDYSFSKVKERYKVWTGRSMDEKEYESFGIVGVDGRLTNAGALLADESPIRYSRVFCTRWNGKTKSGGIVDALDHKEFSGSLISLLNDAEAFIKNNSKTMWKKTDNSRLEFPEYVHRSYFEALVNALVHRDYVEYGSEVHVDIFDDRMEIYSPGGMVDGTRVQDRNIDRIPSRRRNPVLADIFDRLGYMERSGSGLGKIRDGYENAANFTSGEEPEFYSDRTEFIVTFPNLNYGKQLVEESDDTSAEKLADKSSDSAVSADESAESAEKSAESANSADKSAESAEKSAESAEPAELPKPLTKRQVEIVSKMEVGREYSAGEIADMIGLKIPRTRQLLVQLANMERIRMTATTKNRRYVKVPPARS